MSTKKLDAQWYDTDKIDLSHYLRAYEKFFAPLAEKEVKLLELGILKGGSLLMWRDYFEKGTIAGLDVDPCPIEDKTGRIRVYRGMQDDLRLLDRIRAESAPGGFDIIIDDCSHMGEQTRISFWHLFLKHLKPGGIYAIEDWGTGYWGDWPDGKRYRQYGRPSFRYRVVSLLLRLAARMTGKEVGTQWVLRLRKYASLRQRFKSHDYGMVGLVKQLMDEQGMGDITRPVSGIAPYRPSYFTGAYVSHSHIVIIKSADALSDDREAK